MDFNFPLILLILTLATGCLWFIDRRFFRKQRSSGSPEPLWVEWGASFFPVLCLVFILRSFLVEPFRIPSGSMMPTLIEGDFILVNKFIYGIRLPVIDTKIIPIRDPARGEVLVFRFPENTAQNYIKRIVGIPGDQIIYKNKRLNVNGKDIGYQVKNDYVLRDNDGEEIQGYLNRLQENLDTVHDILEHPLRMPVEGAVTFSAFRENCEYFAGGFSCKVPAGHYFVLGDNRDNSRDSRYWGFVPDSHVVGNAFFIWMHLKSVLPPSGFSFDRLGSFK